MEFMTFNFSLQAIDQVINSAAKQLYMSAGTIPVPIVFRCVRCACKPPLFRSWPSPQRTILPPT